MGNIIWSRKYTLTIPGAKIHDGNQTNQSTIYKDGYLYLTINYSVAPISYYSCISKIDLAGNIVWSKSIPTQIDPYCYIANPPSFYNDTLHIFSNIRHASASIDSAGIILTKLDPVNGNIYRSEKIMLENQNTIKGILAYNNTIDQAGDIVISGVMIPGAYMNKSFILEYERSTGIISGWYANHNINNLHGPPSSKFAMNEKGVVAINFDIPFFDPSALYFLMMDRKGNILQSKIFRGLLYGFVTNLHLSELNVPSFAIHGAYPNEVALHYVTVNNNDSLLCTGKDSAMFTPVPLSFKKSSFTWPSVIDGLLTSAPFSLIESNTSISEETFCTDQSICDTIKITGPTKLCLPQDTAIYRLVKNPLCKRKTVWQTDTSAIKITATEGENSIKVKILRPYTGYIKAWYDGCELADSLLVEVNAAMPSLSAGNDTSICPAKPLYLKATPGFSSYQWSTGSTADSTLAHSAGMYYLTATDSCGNVFADTVRVFDAPANLQYNYEKIICQFDTAHIILNNRFSHYSWQPADKGILNNGQLHLFPGASTLYTITAELLPGCVLSDTLYIRVENCPIYFYVPNAFTPNNDGINDAFKPLIKGPLQEYRLEIFNRFGNKVFTSTNPQMGWDGHHKNTGQENAVFVWVCSYRFAGREAVTQKGTVMLIR